MRTHILAVGLICLLLPSCTSFFKPAGWPIEVVADKSAAGQTIDHVRFVGSTRQLTKQENALLTFLNKPDNIAAAVGKVNHPGAHQWTAAEIYRVDPGKHISVLCENGYQQVAVYFHYREDDFTWFRVGHLEDRHGKGIPAVVVK